MIVFKCGKRNLIQKYFSEEPSGLGLLVEILFLALIYSITSRIGQIFSIPPGNITPIWLPSGIIFMAVLLRGYRIWPGVFIGAFAGNIWSYIEFTSSITVFKSVVSASLNGVGDVLCAVLSVYFFIRATRSKKIFKDIKSVGWFIFSGGVLGPFISAFFGVTSLGALGFLPEGSYFYSMLTWWTGDGVGVLVLSPFLLSIISYKTTFSFKKVFSYCLFLTVFCVVFFWCLQKFSLGFAYYPPVYILIPFFVLSAIQFDRRFTFLLLLISISLFAYSAATSTGPFLGKDINLVLLEFQLFAAVISITTLFLHAAITQRKEYQTILQTEKSRLSKAQQIGIIGSWELDLADNVLTLSDENRQIFGITESGQLTFESLLKCIHPDDKEFLNSQLQANALEGKPYDIEHRIIVEGEIKWVREKAEFVFDENGKAIRAIGVTQDITNRKAAEKSLIDSEEKFRTLVDISPVGIYLADEKGNCLFVNNKWCSITGLTFKEALGQGWVKGLNSQDLDRVLNSWLEFTNKSKEFKLEYRFRRPDGRISWVEGRAAKFVDSEGKKSGFVGTIADVTERKRAELQLKKEKNRAESASKAKSQFLANMSHEIRTPMSVIIGFSNMLMKEGLAHEHKAYAELINNASNSLLDIINDILDISKVEAGKLEMIPSRFSLKNILRDVELIIAPLADKKNLEFEVSLSEDLPDIIFTDEKRLHQCLINLISNAIKFTEEGYVHLNVFRHKQDGKEFILFDVKDTGIGVPEDKQGHIFESFAQAEKGNERKFGGTGLGLTITNQLARLLGGQICMTSEEGKGSTFYLSIPVRSDGPEGGFTAQRKPAAENSVEKKEQVYSGRVLVAEDDEGCRILEVKTLERLGLNVATANNGKEAVQRALSESFDLILMDIRMPNMDGFQALKRLHEKGITTPIVALTAHAMDGYDQLCLKSGYDDYLEKPIDETKLQKILDKYFRATV